MNTARLAIDLGDAEQARAVHAALQPELRDGPEGTVATAVVEGSVITTQVEAPDVSSLRAAINSVVRLLDAARRAAS